MFGTVGCKTLSGPSQWLPSKPKTRSTEKKSGDLDEAPAFRGQNSSSGLPPFEPAFPFESYSNPAETTPLAGSSIASSPAPVASSTQPMHDPWSAITAPSPTNFGSETINNSENSLPPTVPSAGNWGTSASPLPTATYPQNSSSAFGDAWDDPWGFGLPESGGHGAVSIDSAAKREEAEIQRRQQEQDKERLEQLAMTKQTAPHLQPLTKWNGPFETREKKQTIEQDIIRQVGHVEVTPTRYDNTPVFDWEKENEKGFDWSVLDPVNFFTKIRDMAGMGPDEKKADAAMKKGRELLMETPDMKDRKKTVEAAKLFKEAAKRWPDSVVEEDALHLAAECYFFSDDYPRAMKMYQSLIIKYQHSKYVDNAVRRLFKIARYWENEDRRGISAVNFNEKSRPTFDTFGYSQKAYETIFIHDPNGPISDDAVMALASAHLARGRYQGDGSYEKAAYYYGYLRENYPLSKHIAKAHEYELYARTHAYLGAEYNGKTLDEAGKLAETTLRQFSGELDGEDKEEVLSLKENVIERQAEREWTMGQYWEKKKYYRSASLYYEKLLDQYPQTRFAEMARSRLEEIKDKPPIPDQFEFFKKIYMPRSSFQ